ncbi:hypothetical protein COOONC_14152 [Cooperia oncophora]
MPWRNSKERVDRIETCHEVPREARFAHVKPRQVYQQVLLKVHNSEVSDERERDEMLGYFVRNGYESRRSAFARATAKLHDRRVTMDNVPREYAFLRNGTPFLQLMSPDLHIYYTPDVIAKACRVGLRALVADGVHDLQPQITNKRGQLYTGFPLAFAIALRKNQRMHERIFRAVRDAIIAAGGPEDIRIGHGAYGFCAQFLDYLQRNWYEGPFRDMCNKWNKKSLRTTNVAEAFNRFRTGSCAWSEVLPLGGPHSRTARLRGEGTRNLDQAERRRAEPKRVRPRDIQRRRHVNREMARFKAILRRNTFIRTSTITTYCCRMSQFVTRQAHTLRMRLLLQ